jgi:hypothetical protein
MRKYIKKMYIKMNRKIVIIIESENLFCLLDDLGYLYTLIYQLT